MLYIDWFLSVYFVWQAHLEYEFRTWTYDLRFIIEPKKSYKIRYFISSIHGQMGEFLKLNDIIAWDYCFWLRICIYIWLFVYIYG